MSKTIEASAKVVIHKPLAQVYAYTTHPQHAQEWYSNVVESKLLNPEQGVVVGAKANLLTRIMGSEMNFLYEITAIENNKSILMEANSGPFPMEAEYQFNAIDENTTEVTIINRASPKGVPFFMVSMIKGKVQQTMDQDVLKLKEIVESLN